MAKMTMARLKKLGYKRTTQKKCVKKKGTRKLKKGCKWGSGKFKNIVFKKSKRRAKGVGEMDD
jgi:hypothetical protein